MTIASRAELELSVFRATQAAGVDTSKPEGKAAIDKYLEDLRVRSSYCE